MLSKVERMAYPLCLTSRIYLCFSSSRGQGWDKDMIGERPRETPLCSNRSDTERDSLWEYSVSLISTKWDSSNWLCTMEHDPFLFEWRWWARGGGKKWKYIFCSSIVNWIILLRTLCVHNFLISCEISTSIICVFTFKFFDSMVSKDI